ncbi:MAG: alanine/ornithine racemase family PLP-dependent enzyme [Rubricoccaceae bacterium]|nr:alanine/ornithine racemase family PLP-dependent enzyme [Rubricoccaceae bacterium]
MAILKLNRDKLQHNYRFLDHLFEENDISWGIVSKLLCGNRAFLGEVIDLGIKEIHDSRVSNLKVIKSLDPEIQTVYIKPPPKRSIPNIVRFADVSLNTEYETIRMLSEEAVRQEKTHKVIIMIELGDLREGVLGDQLLEFYKGVFELPNIEIIGLGTNLNCLHGIMPSKDKLIQLSLYKQLIEVTFGRKIPWVSGGTSVTIPLIFRKQLPKGVNHFRVGETLFFGRNLFSGKVIKGMESGIFELLAEVIEVNEKPVVPHGLRGEDPSGEVYQIDPSEYGKESTRAILDIGLLDVSPKYLLPKNKKIKIAGGSSDMILLDLGKNAANVKVGDQIPFSMKYMGALQLLNSDYVEKVVR